jgi:hypothetical protein
MTATINGIDSVINEIDRLHSILADDVASLHLSKGSEGAIDHKLKVATMLDSARSELEGLKGAQNRWSKDVLRLN